MKLIGWMFFFLVFSLSCNLISDKDDNEKLKKEVVLSPEVYIDKLSNTLHETSGLIWFDNKTWSLNDGGGKNEIYAIDLNGEVALTVELDEAVNHDWEAIAHDEDYIYVGDIGNNKGNRTDLKVYKIMKEDLYTDEQFLKVTAEKIEFSYLEQDNFTEREYAHEFDCAAMFAYQEYLYLFSKDWKNFKTKVYKLSKEPGEYELSPAASFDINGLVAGADLSFDGKYLALVGYSIGGYNFVVPFVYLFQFNSVDIFGSKSVFFDLSSISGSQTEGICFLNEDTLLISTEATNSYVQQAFSINFAEYLNHFD